MHLNQKPNIAHSNSLKVLIIVGCISFHFINLPILDRRTTCIRLNRPNFQCAFNCIIITKGIFRSIPKQKAIKLNEKKNINLGRKTYDLYTNHLNVFQVFFRYMVGTFHPKRICFLPKISIRKVTFFAANIHIEKCHDS